MILGKSHPTLCLHISPCEEDTDLLWKASRRGRYCSWHRSRAEVFLEKQGWNWKGSYCCDRWLQRAVPSVQVPLRTANPGEAAVPLSNDGSALAAQCIQALLFAAISCVTGVPEAP